MAREDKGLDCTCFFCGTNRAKAILAVPLMPDTEIPPLLRKYIVGKAFPTCFHCINPTMDYETIVDVFLNYAEEQHHKARGMASLN